MQSITKIALAYAANALWQTPLLFLATEITCRLIRRARGGTLHRLWLACAILALAVPAIPLIPAPQHLGAAALGAPMHQHPAVIHLPFAQLPTPISSSATPIRTGISISDAWQLAALWLYGGTVLFALARLLWGLRQTQNLVRASQDAAQSTAMQRTWSSCLSLFGSRAVGLRETSMLSAPATLSWPAPMVLLPAGYDAEDAKEMEAVFCHELAHVQRKDFLWNLAIESFGIVLFYHPAFHWMRRRLQETRELACDDMAAQAIAGRHAYARHLLSFTQKMLSANATEKPGCALGIFEGEVLERRIMKLLETGSHHTRIRVVTSFALGTALVAATCILSAEFGMRAVRAQAAPAASQAPAGWFLAGSKPASYQTGVDKTAVRANDLPSAFLKSTVSPTGGFGTLMQMISASDYAGKRVRLRAAVRAKNVDEWAGLWMRVDKEHDMVAFDNMQQRGIRGTQEWKTYDVVLNVPQDATGIAFGILLSGTGEVWLNDVNVEMVGSDVPVTASSPQSQTPSHPTNLKFTE